MPTGATITEIAARAAEAPERFRVTVTPQRIASLGADVSPIIVRGHV